MVLKDVLMESFISDSRAGLKVGNDLYNWLNIFSNNLEKTKWDIAMI